MSACIIPAGPEFQDPPGIPDSPPFIVSASPEIGSTTTVTEFSIVVSDPNVQDDLHVRWLADWPETFAGEHRTLVRNFPISHDASGKRLMASSTALIDCTPATNLFPLPTHRVMAVVADRDFDDTSTTDATAVKDNGHRTLATWVWSVTCPQQQ